MREEVMELYLCCRHHHFDLDHSGLVRALSDDNNAWMRKNGKWRGECGSFEHIWLIENSM